MYFTYIIRYLLIVAHTQSSYLSPLYPDIMKMVGATPQIFHYATSAHTFGVAVGSIIFGLYSDILGRKKILLYSLYVSLISFIAILLTTNSFIYIILRFLSGLGDGVPISICVAMIGDKYVKKEFFKIATLNLFSFVLAKSIFPILSSNLSNIIGVNATILLFGLCIFISVILCYSLPETLKDTTNDSLQSSAYVFLTIIENIKILLSSTKMVSYMMILGFAAAVLITFSASSPIIMINHLGISKTTFAYYISSIWLTFAVSSLISRFLINKISLRFIRNLGFLFTAIGLLFLDIVYYIWGSPFLIVISLNAYAIGAAFIIDSMFPEAVFFFNKLKGSCASILAFFRVLISSSCIGICGFFYNGTLEPLLILFNILLLFMAILIIFLKRNAPA